MTRSLSAAAAPPFVSQVAFSTVSFLSISGLARTASANELATVIAAYSLESIIISYGNARWIGLMIQREAHGLRQGDLRVITRAFLGLALISSPLFFTGALLVDYNPLTAFCAAAWTVSMCLGDFARIAASRFLTVLPVALVGFSHLALVAYFTFFISLPVTDYLLTLAAAALVSAACYWITLRRTCPEGKSRVWSDDLSFGRTIGSEGLMTSAAAGLGGVATSVLNPGLAVGLQLATQILAMPAGAISQALALPLVRRTRTHLAAGTYPRRLIAWWALFNLALPLVGFLLLVPAKPLVTLLLGKETDHAYLFLPVILLQTMFLLGWEPMLLVRRWTHSPRSARNHVVITVACYFIVLTALAAASLPEDLLQRLLVVSATVFLISAMSRAVRWLRTDTLPGNPA